jgi:hypothetical protein
MTSAQIEYAAREFCRRTGRDPDSIDHHRERLMDAATIGEADYMLTQLWQEYAGRVEEEYERMCMTDSILMAIANPYL